MKKNKIMKTIALLLIYLIIAVPIALAQKTSPTETALTEINFDIPEFFNQKKVIITGITKSNSQVNVYVDNVIERSATSRVDGSITFSDLNLETGKHIIKIIVGSDYKEYPITIDTSPPDLKVKEIPELITEKEFNITGSVDEQSNVSLYVFYGEEDATVPAKISGLKVEKIDKNLIRFSWTAATEEDFYKYIIYRDNVAIAQIEKKDYTTFSDLKVNSNTAYTYQVAAMDKAGNVGLKSESLTATTLESGLTDKALPEEIDPSIVVKPTEKINTDNKFDVTLKSEKDGIYRIRIEAVDRAGNKAEFERKVMVDTEPPKIDIIKPETRAFFYEHYADEVDITGKTEPNSNVYLYIERTPFGRMDKTFEISGIPDEIQGLTDAKLRADCRLKGIGSCKTNADYDIKADADGNFKFENVDLTASGIALGIERVPLEDLEIEEKETRVARLLFIAEDIAGHKGTTLTSYRIGTCWSGNFTWEITPLIQYQSPTFLSTERLAEGTEALYFYFNLSYTGTAESAQVSSLTLSSACGGVKDESRFNHSCEIIRHCRGNPNSDRTTWRFACPLDPIEGMDAWLEDDWKSFFKAIGNEMGFPFKVRIGYTETQGNRRSGSKYQTSCEEVTYVVDNSRIDPRNVLPDFMLYDTVDWMEKSSEKLTEAMGYVDTVLEWTGAGCLGSYVLKLGTTFLREFSCSMEGWTESINPGFTPEDGTEKCPATKEGRNELTNFELERDCKKCDAAWKREAKLYKLYRGLCDRVFCHTAPAKWTEDESDEELVDAVEKEKAGCGDIDASVLGQVIRKVKCRDLKKRYEDFISKDIGEFDYCFEVNLRSSDGTVLTYVYSFDPNQNPSLTTKNIYRLVRKERRPSPQFIYAIKQTENSYLTTRPLKCEEFCEGKGYTARKIELDVTLNKVEGDKVTNQKRTLKNINADALLGNVEDNIKKEITDEAKTVEILQDGEKIKSGYAQSALIEGNIITVGEDRYKITKVIEKEIKEERSKGAERGEYWSCTTTKQCNGLNEREVTKPFPNEFTDLNPHKEYKATTYGYTSDCFPEYPLENVDIVTKKLSTDPETREECCCFGEREAIPEEYYTINDKKNNILIFSEEERKDDYPAFNYRYNRIKFKTNEGHYMYNRYRYVEGRDRWGCFGWNNVWLRQENKLMHDPFKVHTSAVQCLCLSGIYSRLRALRNIVEAMKNCLIEIRETGTADAGVCKEIFSQYVCSLLGRFIMWARTGCIGGETGVSLTDSENKILATFGRGMDAVAGAVEEASSELGEEYGNTIGSSLLGFGEESVARKLCLGALGYDWDPDWRAVIDIAYATPMATLVVAPTRSKEYLTFEPESGQSTYEYRASWIINPGCDMDNYNVYLSCVSQEELNKPGVRCDTEKGCDCLNHDEQTTMFYDGRGLTHSALEDRDYHRILTRPYRYDHLKFVLTPSREIKRDLWKDCFPEGHGDGVFYFPLRDKTATDLFGCHVDATSGKFVCEEAELFFGEKPIAYFISNEINGEDPEMRAKNIVMNEGEDLTVRPEIWKSAGDDVCLMISVSDTHEYPDMPVFKPVAVEGVFQYPKYTILENVRIRGRGMLKHVKELTMELYGEQDFEPGASFNIQFQDKWDKSGKLGQDDGITISEDSEDTITYCGVDEKIGEIVKKNKEDYGDKYEEGTLIISCKGITIKITRLTNVLPYKPEKKRTEGDIYETASNSIPIETTDTSKNQQIKTITLSLVRLKQGIKKYEDGEDCNPADVIRYDDRLQEREYRVNVVAERIEERVEVREEKEVTEGSISIKPSKVTPNQEIEIKLNVPEEVIKPGRKYQIRTFLKTKDIGKISNEEQLRVYFSGSDAALKMKYPIEKNIEMETSSKKITLNAPAEEGTYLIVFNQQGYASIPEDERVFAHSYLIVGEEKEEEKPEEETSAPSRDYITIEPSRASPGQDVTITLNAPQGKYRISIYIDKSPDGNIGSKISGGDDLIMYKNMVPQPIESKETIRDILIQTPPKQITYKAPNEKGKYLLVIDTLWDAQFQPTPEVFEHKYLIVE